MKCLSLYNFRIGKLVIFTAVSMSFCLTNTYAQKKFCINLRFEDRIIPKKISIQYYDGKNHVFVPDTLTGNTLCLKGKFYSPLVSIVINYPGSGINNSFFINDKPAKISFKLSEDNKLIYDSITNARPIFDTTNKIYSEILTARKKIWPSYQNFMKKNGNNVFKNDSLTHIYNGLLKMINRSSLDVIKKYPDVYFSFWYFRNQIAEFSLTLLHNDTAYIESLLDYMKTVFPRKYITSIGGMVIFNKLNRLITPLTTYQAAPQFSIRDIKGQNINLQNFKGKYVLLDFWATWCPPCRKEVPIIRKIRNRYSRDDLIIISISSDRNLNNLLNFVKKDKMNWIHIFDRESEINTLYGVQAIPELVLINRSGKLVYIGDTANEEFFDILNDM